ncbi:hypothetical protein ACK3TF_004488 [Chlorella vulgaris]
MAAHVLTLAGVQAAVHTGLVTSRVLVKVAFEELQSSLPSGMLSAFTGGWLVRVGVNWIAGAISVKYQGPAALTLPAGLFQLLLLLEQGTARDVVERLDIWVPVALSAYGVKRIVDAASDYISKWAAYRAAGKATLMWAILADQWLEAERAQQALQELQPQQALEAQQQLLTASGVALIVIAGTAPWLGYL